VVVVGICVAEFWRSLDPLAGDNICQPGHSGRRATNLAVDAAGAVANGLPPPWWDAPSDVPGGSRVSPRQAGG